MNQNGKYLLDTNIIIGMFAADKVIQEKVENTDKMFLAADAEIPTLFLRLRNVTVVWNHQRSITAERKSYSRQSTTSR